MPDVSAAHAVASVMTNRIEKNLGEPPVGSGVAVVAHVHDGRLFSRDAGRLLSYKTVGPLKARMATIHSQAEDTPRDVPAHHLRMLHESPDTDLGDKNVSIRPLRINDRAGTHVVIHDGKVRGTLTPGDMGGLPVHHVSGEMGARSYTDRPTAVLAIRAHYRPEPDAGA